MMKKSLQSAPPKAWRKWESVRQSAFTLIEVLVVVSIIAILAAVLLPSLKRARERAYTSVCMSNPHQLMLGMHMYVADHKRLPGNFTVLSQKGKCGTGWKYWESWLGLPNSWEQIDAAFSVWGVGGKIKPTQDLWQFLEDFAVPKKGTLFKYVKDPKVYLCPKDKRGLPSSDPLGGGGNGVFSYTMNHLIGFKSPESLASFVYRKDFYQISAALPAPFPLIKENTRVIWSPSEMITLMEEHPWNNTNQSVPEDNLGPHSYLCMRHDPQATQGKGMFAFLDGHVEMKRYPFFGEPKSGGGWNQNERPKLVGIDILNQYRLPYRMDGEGDYNTRDDGVNQDEFIHKLR